MKGKEMKKLTLIIIAVMMVFSFTAMAGCEAKSEGSATESEGSATVAEWSISVIDAGGKTVEFTNVDAGKLEMVEIEAVRTKKDGSETNEEWKGVLLSDVLEYCGIAEYNTVAVEASDGYSKELEASAVSDAGTILGFYLDGNEVSVEDGLVQLVGANLPGSFWIKNVAKISVVN
jgi:hypothetical protein